MIDFKQTLRRSNVERPVSGAPPMSGKGAEQSGTAWPQVEIGAKSAFRQWIERATSACTAQERQRLRGAECMSHLARVRIGYI